MCTRGPEDQHEFVYDFLMNALIDSHMGQFIIEIYYVLDEEWDFGLNRFIDCLLVNYRRSDWVNTYTIKELNLLKTELKRIYESTVYIRIKNYRDKTYAHLDKQAEAKLEVLSLNEVLPTLMLLIKITKDLGRRLFNETYKFHRLEMHIHHYMIENLSNFYELRNLLDLAKSENKTSISIIDLELAMYKNQNKKTCINPEWD